ncbi:MAG: helix-turn-helix domain-containing protein [Herpetosiphonaceae bacterium]|nr:helix-turn-helix domain-containing protein [Herpetosiphonaceae bacterium]
MAVSGTRLENDWLTLSQASELLGVHPATLRQWSDEGKINLFRTPGGHRRFARSEIERLLHVLPVRGLGLSAFVASETVERTRHDMPVVLQHQPWMQRLDAEQRDRWRLAGRQLVGLVAQLTVNAAPTEQQRSAAVSLGHVYGQLLGQAGLELPDAVLNFLFFRDSLVETITDLPSTTGLDRDATLATIRRVNSVMNDVLRIMMDSFGEEHAG